MTVYIQRQRQGVANYQRAWFSPCPHGERWHWERNCWYDNSKLKSEVSFPNCRECFGDRYGQLAWQSCHTTEARALAAARKVIQRLIGEPVEFSEDIEHYCYSTARESHLAKR